VIFVCRVSVICMSFLCVLWVFCLVRIVIFLLVFRMLVAWCMVLLFGDVVGYLMFRDDGIILNL